MKISTPDPPQAPSHARTCVCTHLSSFAVRLDADVRQELLLQQVSRVLHALLPHRPHDGTPLANVIQGHLLRLDGEGLLDGGAEQLQHGVVLEVIHNVLQDVLVGLGGGGRGGGRGAGGERVCVCVCVCVRERERESQESQQHWQAGSC